MIVKVPVAVTTTSNVKVVVVVPDGTVTDDGTKVPAPVEGVRTSTVPGRGTGREMVTVTVTVEPTYGVVVEVLIVTVSSGRTSTDRGCGTVYGLLPLIDIVIDTFGFTTAPNTVKDCVCDGEVDWKVAIGFVKEVAEEGSAVADMMSGWNGKGKFRTDT